MKFLFLLLLTSPAFGQLKVETDPFTKQERKESVKWIGLKSSMSNSLQCKIRTVDEFKFIIFNGMGCGTGIIDQDDEFIFLFKDGTTATILPTSLQSYEVSGYLTYYYHQYNLPDEVLDQIATKELKAVRKYYDKGYCDMDIDDKRKSNLMKEAKKFL